MDTEAPGQEEEDRDMNEQECQVVDASLKNNLVYYSRNCYDHPQDKHRPPCLEQNNLLHLNNNKIHNNIMPTMGMTGVVDSSRLHSKGNTQQHPNNSMPTMCNMPTIHANNMGMTEVDSSRLAGERERTHGKEGVYSRTGVQTQPADDRASSGAMEGETGDLHDPTSTGTSTDTSTPLVEDMKRLDMGSNSVQRGDVPEDCSIQYVRYESELQMPDIIRLFTKDLSEPYSIYTYRYFIHNWPQLCFLAMVEEECVGAIVCKLDMHKKMFRRGYIAMLAVDSSYRRKGIGTNLVKRAIYAMMDGDCDEVVLETEITNQSALKLYGNLGFVRDKRLFRYYLNGVDALRLKLWLR